MLASNSVPIEKRPSTDGEPVKILPHKRLTVTFEDIGISVHGELDDYGGTVASVANPISLFSSLKNSQPSERVRLPSQIQLITELTAS